MVAKLLFDVKAKIRLQSCAGATAPVWQLHRGNPVITPPERKQSPIFSLPTGPLHALLLYVDRYGEIEERDGYIGEAIMDTHAVTISEGALWARENGDVVQFFPPGSPFLNQPERIKPGPVNLSEARLVVTGFENNAAGATRATKRATARVLTDLEAFQCLVTLSDDALDHAIGSNLKSEVSIRKHRENIAFLESLARSDGELADEIRAFLDKIKDPRDKRKRHNVYRMVLIVRAVQRRAKAIAEGKGDTLEAVTVIGLDVARYVGAVTATAAKIVTELSDVQPWWTGDDGTLTRQEADKRRKHFVTRLRRYRTELLAMTAKPFRCWTFAAASHIQDLADWIETAQYANVLAHARYVVGLLEAVLVREGVSRCISLATHHETESAAREAIDLLIEVNHWYVTHASALGLAARGQQMFDRILLGLPNGTHWPTIEAIARETERRFDALLT